MGYASKAGRAQTSSRNPRAFAVCDRCGMWYNHDRLRWQFDWRGASIQNIRILVCDHCYDTPQEQLRAIVVPADPTAILNARVEAYAQDETNNRYTSGQNTVDPSTGIPVVGGNLRITQDSHDRVTQQTGEPPGGRNNLPGTDWNAPAVLYNGFEIGLPYNNTTVPYTGPLSPPYNYMVQWNNTYVFGDFWVNTVGAGVNWTTTIL